MIIQTVHVGLNDHAKNMLGCILDVVDYAKNTCYGKCSKIYDTFLFLFLNKILVIRA